MVADEVQGIRGDGFGGDEAFGRFAVVGEFEEVEHVGVFFRFDGRPRLFGDGFQGAADGTVPEFPADTCGGGLSAGFGSGCGGRCICGPDLQAQGSCQGWLRAGILVVEGTLAR